MGGPAMILPSELYACVYAREFPAQAMLRLRPILRRQPCAVLGGESIVQGVCAMNAKARTLGVLHAMSKVDLETIPNIVVLRRSAAEEQATRTAILECAATFSPRIEDRTQNGSFCCVIDITGTERLLGSPEILSATLQSSLKSLGITSSIAVSTNFHVALCLARGMSARPSVLVVPNGSERTALASCALSVLELPEPQAETFSLWGIRTLGMLAALPENELIARMGQAGKQYRQLARGEYAHMFCPVATAFILEERMELDTPVEILESLLFAIGVLLEQVTRRAIARALALASVTLTFRLEGGASYTRTVRPALPTTDRQLWIKLLHLDLEAHPPEAAILALTLKAEPGSTSKIQLGLFSPQTPDPMRLDITLARIRAIVGEENVGCPTLKDTHKPNQFHVKPFAVPLSFKDEVTCDRNRAAIRQLRPIESAVVTLQRSRPYAFVFRETRYVVEKDYGPWLLGGDWWTEEPWDVEQWDMIGRSQDGALLCCCLVRNLIANCWHVAALYD
jgi:protein ImuB